MKGYLIPYNPKKKLGLGDNGHDMEGPILYVPNRGAICYEIGVTGDAEGMGPVICGVGSFEKEEIFLGQIQKAISGEELGGGSYKGECFDLRKGLQEVEISEKEFGVLANTATKAYEALSHFKEGAMKLCMDLEERLGAKRKMFFYED